MFWATTSASLRHATMSIKSAPRLPSLSTKGLSTASVKVATGVPFWVYRRFGSAVKRPMSITLFITQHLVGCSVHFPHLLIKSTLVDLPVKIVNYPHQLPRKACMLYRSLYGLFGYLV